MKEIWKDIKGYESFYQVSNLGNVRSLDRYVKNGTSNRNIKRGRVLKPCINHKGYLQVHLVANGNSKLVVIHKKHIHKKAHYIFLFIYLSPLSFFKCICDKKIS